MTKEQLDELGRINPPDLQMWGSFDGRAVHLSCTKETADLLGLAVNALPRLLKEREMLLAALNWEYEEGDGISQKSVEAIEYAEAP